MLLLNRALERSEAKGDSFQIGQETDLASCKKIKYERM